MNYTPEKVSGSGFKLLKSDLDKLIKVLTSYGEVIAPIKDEQWIRMQSVSKAEEITFEGVSWFTSKKYVFPDKQELFTYKNGKIIKEKKFPKRVLFGLRMCDLNSFHINDKLFLEQEPVNHNYAELRKNLTLVGLWCDTPVDKYCFCDSMKLTHHYDLCLFDRDDYFHIKVGSVKGEEIISKLKLKVDSDYWKEAPKCEMKLNTQNIKSFFDNSEVWKKGVNDCLSCGDCTTLCPTCLCFDVSDDVSLDGKECTRCASWDSCMYKDFTLVAGGHTFRNTRENRFKHRIYHKLDYFPEKYDISMCTGCGRCIRGCPTKIDWTGLVNEMEDSK